VRRAATSLALLAGAAALAAAPAAAGAGPKPQRKTVDVLDNYFAPATLTVTRGSTVTFRWPAEAGDTHDVALAKGPKGVRRWASDPAAADFRYRRRLTKAGSYRIICTFHEEMVMTVRVRR
jgi:plastocyanin